MKDVEKVPPAHVLRISANGGLDVRRYWRPRGQPKMRLEERESTSRLGALFEQSLRRRSSGAGRLGVLLSAGVDSKLIVAGLANTLGASFSTFTFHYTDYEGEFNELDEARQTADHFGTDHHELLLRPSDVADNLEWMLRAHGEPFTWGLHSFLLRDVVSAGVDTLLNGAGPDGWYLDQHNSDGLRYARLPAPILAMWRASFRLVRQLNTLSRPASFWPLYAAANDMVDRVEPALWCAETGLPSSLRGQILTDEWRTAFYDDAGRARQCLGDQRRLLRDVMKDFSGENGRDPITFAHRHFRNAEGILQWNHWWGRAHGLAIRFPFFDNDLLDFVMRLPRESPDKGDVRRLAADYMPREMAYSPKIYQTVPIKNWFRGPLREFLCDHLAPDRLKRFGLFDSDVVQACVKGHLRGKNDNSWKLWAILTVVAWHELVSRGEL